MFKKKSRLLFFLTFILLVAACGSEQENWAGITKAGDDEVYVSYENFIARLDNQGDRVWAYPDKDNRDKRFFANVTMVNDVIYVGDYTGGIHAIDRETGELIWRYSEGEPTKLFGLVNFGGSTDRVIAAVTEADGMLYVPDEHGVFMLDAETGKRLNKEREEDASAVILETKRAIWSQPVFVPASDEHPARLFVTALDHYIYAINHEDGSLIWKTDLDGAAPGEPTYDPINNLIYVGTFKSELLALNADNGEILDRFEAKGWVWEGPVLDESGTLYFGDLGGYAYALSLEDGKFVTEWSRQIIEDKIRAKPLMVGQLLIFTAEEGHVFAIEQATGNEEWRKDIEDVTLLSNLIAVESEVDGEPVTLVITATNKTDRLVVGLQADNGSQRWTYEHKD